MSPINGQASTAAHIGCFTSVPGTQEFITAYKRLGDKLLIKLTFIDSENKNIHTTKISWSAGSRAKGTDISIYYNAKLIDLLVSEIPVAGRQFYFVPDTERKHNIFFADGKEEASSRIGIN